MTTQPNTDHAPGATPDDYISTGDLPPRDDLQAVLDDAYARYRGVADGRNSTVYPALARVSPDLFGICLAGVSGNVWSVGDCDTPFTIMSVSKPFVFALVCQAIGHQAARDWLGVNATGLAFNSVMAMEMRPDHRSNPMVNAGALATTSLVPGETAAGKWQIIHEGLSRFAGRELPLNDEVYASATETNHRNRAIVNLLHGYGRLAFDPDETVDLYTRQCALDVTARDLAVMSATLANGGTNPLTGDQVVQPEQCRDTLAVMVTAGMYETSGDWFFDTGLPAKSGIGGGIVTVAPGKGGLATFSPPLDEAGNSVRGQLVTTHLSQRLGLNLLAAAPSA
jgi:glutaminase